MVSVFVSISSGPDSRPGRGHCVGFLGLTLIVSFSVSFSTKDISTYAGGGVEILPVTSYYINWDKLRPDEPLGSYVDLICLCLIWPSFYVYRVH